MRKEDVVIGKTYRIRQWDDMSAEFGVDSWGDVNTPLLDFVEEMKCFCGENYTPTNREETHYLPYLGDSDFCLTAEMLEEITSLDPLKAFIEGYESTCRKHGYFVDADNSGEMGIFIIGTETMPSLEAQIAKLMEDAANVD